MRIIRHHQSLPKEARGAAIAIGNFDGVHKGHQAVIREAGLIAKSHSIPWAVLTFEPHPRSVFQPGQPHFRLTPMRAKARALESLGVNMMIVQHFSHSFSKQPAENFVKNVLVDGLGARHVVAGYDFVFGHNRGGNCELLLTMGQKLGFGFTAVSPIEDDGGILFSSTRIRDYLSKGDVRTAAALLGRHFSYEGRVARGDQRGRTIGFPTLNLELGDAMRPSLGVYAARVGIIEKDKTILYDGVANLGKRPTFGGESVILEVHLFNFSKNLYGKRITVSLIDFIRQEKKFDGLEALRAQIAIDTEKAQNILQSDLTQNQ